MSPDPDLVREARDEGAAGEPRLPRRRPGLGVAIAAGLLVVLVALNLAPRERDEPAALPEPKVTGSAAVDDHEAVVEAAARALEAWGRFAVAGDLTEVAPYFAAEGPQYRRMAEEAPSLAAAPAGQPPYRYALREPEVVEGVPGERTVRATVVVSRPGEPDRTFRWDIGLRRAAGRWVVWSVDPAPG